MATQTTPTAAPREIALSAAWQAQAIGGPIRTREGQTVEIVSRGTWTHGFGPDFRDAMISLNGRELRSGSIEIHLATRGWSDHGHATDPRYNDVILHVVLEDDGSETRREDGAVVPVVAVGALLTTPLDGNGVATGDWSRFGGAACAPDLVREQPAVARQVLFRLGDIRLAGRSARLEAQLTALPPAQVLYASILDGLGYQQNREPMTALAELVPLADLEAVILAAPLGQRHDVARGILLGAAGFLPLSPTEASLAHLDPTAVERCEAGWRRSGGPWMVATMLPTAWTRARVRPANHPAARLVAGATLIANCLANGGLVATLTEPIRARVVVATDQPGRLPDLTEHLRSLSTTETTPGLGLDRAGAIVASALLPFALALAQQNGDAILLDGAALVWERLAGPAGNAVTRRAMGQVAGEERLTGLGARGQQGLIHLDQTLCAPRRCRECPIAHAAVSRSPTAAS
jgi:hypothetical protein